MKKEQKKPSLPPVPKDLDPKVLEKVMKDSDLIVCAKIGAAMRKYVTMHVVKAVQQDIAEYRDCAMMVVDPSPDNAKMVVSMLYDQAVKAFDDIVDRLRIERFVDKNARCPMEALVFEEEK